MITAVNQQHPNLAIFVFSSLLGVGEHGFFALPLFYLPRANMSDSNTASSDLPTPAPSPVTPDIPRAVIAAPPGPLLALKASTISKVLAWTADDVVLANRSSFPSSPLSRDRLTTTHSLPRSIRETYAQPPREMVAAAAGCGGYRRRGAKGGQSTAVCGLRGGLVFDLGIV